MAKTVVLEVAGKVTIGHDVELRQNVQAALAAGAENVVIDMERVTRMDSSGIGELVAAHVTMKNKEGRLLLVGLPGKIATVLQITQMLGVLELYDDADSALATLDDD